MIIAKKNTHIYQTLYIFLFSLTPLVDSLNGFFILSLKFPSFLGQSYRLILICILLVLMIHFQKRKDIPFSYSVMYYLVFISFIYGYVYSSVNILANELLEVSKIIYIIMIIQTYCNLYKSGKVSFITLEKIFKVSLMSFPLFIVIPRLFGLGYAMYETTDTGYSGFFYAANDLNIVLLIMLIFSIESLFYNIRTKNKYLYYAISSFLLIVSLILTGAKSSISFCGIIVFITLLRYFVTSNLKSKFKILISSIFVIIVALFIINKFYYNDIQAIIQRHSYFLENDNGDIFTFLLTGRNLFLQASYQSLLSSNHILLRIFFGISKYYHMEETGMLLNLGHPKDIEMDMFDIFFSYGLVGVIFVFGYFSRFIYMAFKREIMKHYFKYTFSLFISITYSFFAGHLLFSALSGTYFALICCGLYVLNQKSARSQ